ncbi:MAG: signal peptidase II [Candidatus Adiutrix sp.]|jgi:signal peptidase II|nr:signal peptidase II [Candidatus Adiutrix sp.]
MSGAAAVISRPASKWKTVGLWGGLTLTLDLLTKVLARQYFNPWEPLTVIPGCFNLVLAHNTGAAFSLFAEAGGAAQGWKMAALATVSLLPFIYFYRRAAAGERWLLAGLGLIWGGALGNIHDRLHWGAVVDFLDFYWAGRHWPAFNVADMAICLGAGLMALSLWREKPALNSGEAK